MAGQAMHAVLGGDWDTPLPAVRYSEPKAKPKGLDWSKHRAPEPEPTPIVERPEATVTEIRRRIKAPRPKVGRKCACGADISTRSDYCRTCNGRRTAANRHTYKTRTSVVDVTTARTEYLEGASCPEIAERHDWPITSVRRQLAKAGVQMRDDRAGRVVPKKVYDPELVAKVRVMYVDQGMSQVKIAQHIGTSTKVVQNLMKREGIPARQGASGGGDTLQGYRDRLDELGVTSADVRAWANKNGHPAGIRGVVAEHVIDAYEAAHQPTPTTQEETA